MARRPRQLIAPDRGLQLRMVLTAVVTPVFVLATTVAIFLSLSWEGKVGLLLALGLGVSAATQVRRSQPQGVAVTVEAEPELHGIVERLCVRADIGKPVIIVEDDLQPNSWVVDLPGRPPRLHLTRGLVDVLEPGELEAVIAHELSHVAHGDATVMTVVGLPGAALRAGGAQSNAGMGVLYIGALFAWVIGTLGSVGTNMLARHRELSADAGAAALTGRPSALASALMKLADQGATRVPVEDLRVAAARNAFNLLPIEAPPAEGWLERRAQRLGRTRPFRRVGATHPPVARRVAALRRAEEQLQAARR